MELVDRSIEEYCSKISSQPSELCFELAEYTRKNVAQSQMLIGPLEASLLGFLIRTGNYKRVLEIGTFTGYSALAMAENLPDNAELVSLDINEETTKIARSFWNRSPHGKKIKHIHGPALESLKKISGPFDFVFIDADKEPYLQYLEKSLELLSPSGSIVIDNCLWSGRVLEQNATGSTQKIQEVNAWASQHSSSQLYVSLLPVRDGMLLIRKR